MKGVGKRTWILRARLDKHPDFLSEIKCMKWRSHRFPAFSIWFLSVCKAEVPTSSGTFVIKLPVLCPAVWIVFSSWYGVKNARSSVLPPWHTILHCCTHGSAWHFLSLLPLQVKRQYQFCNQCTFTMATSDTVGHHTVIHQHLFAAEGVVYCYYYMLTTNILLTFCNIKAY